MLQLKCKVFGIPSMYLQKNNKEEKEKEDLLQNIGIELQFDDSD